MPEVEDLSNPQHQTINAQTWFRDADNKGGVYVNTYKGDTEIVIPETQPDAETAVLLSAENGKYIERTFLNLGEVTVWLGNTDEVTVENGFPLLANKTFVDDKSKSAWYGIAGAEGAVDIRVVQIVKDEIE